MTLVRPLLAALAAGGVAIGVATVATGSDDQLVVVNAVTAASASPGNASNIPTLDSRAFEGISLQADRAVTIDSPDGSGRWTIIPGHSGICLSPGDGSTTCGSADDLNAGRIISMTLQPDPAEQEAIGAAVRRLSAGPSRTENNGGNAKVGKLSGTATYRGLAPDGVSTVSVLDESGRPIGSGPVTSNGYIIEGISLEDAASLSLKRVDGSSTITRLRP